MLHEALMLEIYRQALNAGALPTARPRSTESANSSERCPSHDSNSSENGRGGDGRDTAANAVANAAAAAAAAASAAGILPLPATMAAAFPGAALPPHHHQQHHQQQQQQHQNMPAAPPTMEAYLQMVAAAAQQYGFPLVGGGGVGVGGMGGGAVAAHQTPRFPPLPTMSAADAASAPFKLPPQASPNATNSSSNNSEALDFRTSVLYGGGGRASSADALHSSEGEADAEPEDEDEYDDEAMNDVNNPLDLSVGTRKRSADGSSGGDSGEHDPSSMGHHIQVKKIFKSDSPPALPNAMSQAAAAAAAAAGPPPQLLPAVNPYLAAVAAANIFRTGQFPDWNGKSDLVVDPLEKMSDIVKGGGGGSSRKEKSARNSAGNTAGGGVHQPPSPAPQSANAATSSATSNTHNSTGSNALPATESAGGGGGGGMSKARHNIWQSHWQNKGVASSVFRCVWCKQSFSTLEALTTHMKDSKHCGVNVPPFGNLPTNNTNNNNDRYHHHNQPQQQQQQHHQGAQHSHNLRKPPNGGNTAAGQPSAAAKNAFQYRGDPPTPLPRKLVRGQNVWLGKGVEQAMQILKCMRCGESFRSLGEMTKHMQETQHYTNILSQEQTISMKSGGGNSSSADAKDGHNSLSSEESRTLSAVLTCKVCDKAFNSLGDLSNHMAKNNHYAEPLMQSMAGGAGSRKRPAPKKREKSLPVRKLLEMKGAAAQQGGDSIMPDSMEAKLQRSYEGGGSNKRNMPLEGTGIGPGGNDKSDAALFAERMRQYISGVKGGEDDANKTAGGGLGSLLHKNKSPELEPKNGATKTASTTGSSSVLSAIEQMFTTSFDTPTRHTTLPASSPSNSSTKNTSPVASSILKRLGIDETVDYNKPLIDTSDPYYQHYRYTSSERSGSECSAETPHMLEASSSAAARKMDAITPERQQQQLTATPGLQQHPLEAMSQLMEPTKAANEIKRERELDPQQQHGDVIMAQEGQTLAPTATTTQIKMEIKSELVDESERAERERDGERETGDEGQQTKSPPHGVTTNGGSAAADYTLTYNNNNTNNNNNNNNNNNRHSKERSLTPPKPGGLSPAAAPLHHLNKVLTPRSPTDSHRSLTPKSPASSIKSYDGEKKYPSDSLNALSSMFDSLGSSSSNTNTAPNTRAQQQAAVAASTTTMLIPSTMGNKLDSPENLSTSNSLAALRQFCIKKEKTA